MNGRPDPTRERCQSPFSLPGQQLWRRAMLQPLRLSIELYRHGIHWHILPRLSGRHRLRSGGMLCGFSFRCLGQRASATMSPQDQQEHTAKGGLTTCIREHPNPDECVLLVVSRSSVEVLGAFEVSMPSLLRPVTTADQGTDVVLRCAISSQARPAHDSMISVLCHAEWRIVPLAS